MKTILIVGKNFTGLKEQILESGNEYILLQDKLATKFPDKKFKRRVVADFSNEASLLATVDTISKNIDGVMTIYENYVYTTALIANHLGLPGMPLASAKACTDKYEMRTLFAKAPKKISPGFAEVHSLDDVLAFAEQHDFPIILKPANLAKSLLVFKNNNLEELKENYANMLANIDGIYKKYAPLSTPRIVIEEFMVGPIHSVDAFVDKDGTPHILDEIVDYQTGYDIGYDDNFHYSRILPSKLTSNEAAQVKEVAELGCKALGMKSSAAHIEIIRTKEGPMIVEIGARNGGYRERMHRLANGINTVENAMNLALDLPIDITAAKHESCAVLELFPKQKGTYKGLQNEDALRSLSSLNYFSHKQKIGSIVGKSSDGYKMCAVIILHNNNVSTFNSDLQYINENVFVVTE